MIESLIGLSVWVYVGAIFTLLAILVLILHVLSKEHNSKHDFLFCFFIIIAFGCIGFGSIAEGKKVNGEDVTNPVEQEKVSLEKDTEVEVTNYYGSQNVLVVTKRVKGSYLVEFKNGDFSVVEVVDGEIVEELVSKDRGGFK